MDRYLQDASLSEMFGLDLVEGADDAATLNDTAAVVEYRKMICQKCKGTGQWIGRYKTFSCYGCGGTGIEKSVGVQLAEDDCKKCLGTGQFSPGRSCFACNATGKIAGPAAEITVDAIATAFANARAHGVQKPKLRLADFVFSRAPDHGKNAGSIYVTRDGEYLGKVTDGRFHSTMVCDAPTKAKVIEVAADPHKAAKAYGAKTGTCACCGRELTRADSIARFLGPICAERYGWLATGLGAG